MRKLNSFLRWLFILFGGMFLLLGFLPEKKEEPVVRSDEDREGFEKEEFDDIW
ncbi:MAG: hypothetical protein ACSW8G_01435 [Bacillota bacterium]